MIEVMLASRLTRDGVDGVRWVLLEEAAAVHATAPAKLLAEATASAVALPGRSLRSVLVQGALSWLTYGLGLLVAVWLAYSLFGPPGPAGQPETPRAVALPLLGPAAVPAVRQPKAPATAPTTAPATAPVTAPLVAPLAAPSAAPETAPVTAHTPLPAPAPTTATSTPHLTGSL